MGNMLRGARLLEREAAAGESRSGSSRADPCLERLLAAPGQSPVAAGCAAG